MNATRHLNYNTDTGIFLFTTSTEQFFLQYKYIQYYLFEKLENCLQARIKKLYCIINLSSFVFLFIRKLNSLLLIVNMQTDFLL